MWSSAGGGLRLCELVSPVFIASQPYWQKRFVEKGLPIIGDDIRSQVGATITHRVLTTLFGERGVHLDRTYQLNFGGNMDFYNMLERERLESKKISKTQAVTSMVGFEMDPDNIHVGPSDYVPWLTDRKFATFGWKVPTLWKCPHCCSSASWKYGTARIQQECDDAIRCIKLALDRASPDRCWSIFILYEVTGRTV